MDTQLYLTNINTFDNTLSFGDLYEMLPEWRREKIDHLKTEASRRLSLGAGLLFSYALTQNNINPYNTKIELGSNLKPYLSGYPEVYFNLSHSGNMVLCMIGSSENGCDIEIEDKYKKSVAKRFFHEDEYNWIESHEDIDKLKCFYRIWTLKESFMKITGLGMSLDMKDYQFNMNGISPTITQNITSHEYYIKEYDEISGYSIACMSLANQFPEHISIVNVSEFMELKGHPSQKKSK